MAAKLQCEICGGKLIGKPGGIFECENCGTEYSTEWAKAKIQEITGTVKVEGTVEVTGKVQVDSSASKEALLQRGNLALEDGKWEEAKGFFDRALDLDAQCAEAYLGLAMAEEQCRDRERFWKKYSAANSPLRLNGNGNLARAQRFSAELNDRIKALDEEGKRTDERKKKADEDAIIEKEKRKKLNYGKLKTTREKLAPLAVMIDAGHRHTIGLRVDGTVISTKFIGDFYVGQCDVSSWTDIVAIAAGDSHTVGLRADGTVIATNYTSSVGNFGQCEVSNLRNIVAIAAGESYTVGLRKDGTVTIIGSSADGMNEVSTWRNIVAISARGYHIVGLRKNGTVVAAGENEYGQCNVSGWTDIVAVAAGDAHTVGLKGDGTVVAVGHNGYGQCKFPDGKWKDIVAIAAGNEETVGLRADGKVVSTAFDREIESWTNIVAIASGWEFTVGLRSDGTLVTTKLVINKFTVTQYNGQCEVSDWKLFNSVDTIDAEKRSAKIEALNRKKAQLQAELANLKGLFSSGKRRDLEARIAGIDSALKKLG